MANDKQIPQNSSVIDIVQGNYNQDGNPVNDGAEDKSSPDIVQGKYNKKTNIANVRSPQLSSTKDIVEGDLE